MKKKILVILTVMLLIGALIILNHFTYYYRVKHTYMEAKKVEYITMRGGGLGRKIWTKLECTKDYEKIKEIIHRLNSYKKRHRAKTKELKFLGLRRGNPSSIQIMMKNGIEFNIITVSDIKSFENGYQASWNDEKVLIEVLTNNKPNYFIVESKELASYLAYGSKKDIPLISNN